MDDEAIWQEDPKALQDSEWSRLSLNFTNAGYREGITAGKESALQRGFDEGFAEVGVPLGRELGILRGMASALLCHLTSTGEDPQRQGMIHKVRGIASQLSTVRFSDIAPPDLEAERHAREHLDTAEGEEVEQLELELELNEELQGKRSVESLEDMMVQMSTGSTGSAPAARPSMDDVHRLQERLLALCGELGLSLQ